MRWNTRALMHVLSLLFLTVLLLVLPLALLAHAGAPFYRQTVSATQTNTVVTFTIPESNNEACRVTIANDGTKTVYVNPNGSVAVVATSIPVLASEIHFLTTTGAYGCIKTLGLICDTGDTASVRVLAFP